MVKLIINIVVVLVAVAGAGFAAMTIRGGGETPEVELVGAPEDGGVYDVHGEKEEKKEEITYFKFKRDFIVPVMRGTDVDSLVLLRLNIEMEESLIEAVTPKEPRVRDAFMKTLMSLSHDGYFQGDITAPEVYMAIQERLYETAKVSMDERVKSVLISDFARQDS